MLIAARSSKDFACCARATACARSKYASAFPASGSGDVSAISPAVRWISASHHRSFVVSASVIASPMQRHASLSWPSSTWALAKCDRYSVATGGDPDERNSLIPEMTAAEALPVKTDTQHWSEIPRAFQNKAPFSARATCSWALAVTAA
jgi:hypothetical protein